MEGLFYFTEKKVYKGNGLRADRGAGACNARLADFRGFRYALTKWRRGKFFLFPIFCAVGNQCYAGGKIKNIPRPPLGSHTPKSPKIRRPRLYMPPPPGPPLDRPRVERMFLAVYGYFMLRLTRYLQNVTRMIL